MTKIKNALYQLIGGNDIELRQSILRVVFLFGALGYILFSHGYQREFFSDPYSKIQTLAFLSICFSSYLLLHTRKSPAPSNTRRLIGIIHDATILTLFFYYGEEMSTPFLFVYPFSAIGNGFRYGEKWLLASTLCGCMGLGFLLMASEYWSSLPMIGTGFAITFIAVVSYTGILLRKLRSTTAQLEKLATHDELTGLPNRRVVMNQLRQALVSNKKNLKSVACIYFDLDGFKQVNDALGHGAGDFLLKEVAQKTRSLIRETDLVARLGGDEFSLVLDSVKCQTDADTLCRQLVESITSIKEIFGHPIMISVSVGCVVIPPGAIISHTEDAEEAIMRQADACMYQSKKSGRGRYTIASHGAAVIHVAA